MARIEKVNAELISMALKMRRGVSYVSLDATEQGKPLYKALGFDDNHENMGIDLQSFEN